MELTNLDVELILYLNYRQESLLGSATMLDLADAKEDYGLRSLLESVNRLEDFGYISCDFSERRPRFSLNAKRHKTRKALNREYKERRFVVLDRDRYICVLCGGAGNCVHHIDYDHDNNEYGNMVTLCVPCHGRTNGGDRDRWRERLVGLVITV